MQLTLHIPDDLAAELRPRQGRLPRILSLGLRELDAEEATGFSGVADVLELLASLPTPDEILALRPSATLQAQIDRLLERNREGDLSFRVTKKKSSLSLLYVPPSLRVRTFLCAETWVTAWQGSSFAFIRVH